MILNNMELSWARLTDPVDNYAKDGKIWSVNAITRDKDQAKKMKEAGMNVKTDDDDKGIFYMVRLQKKVRDENTKAPKVVGRDLLDFEQAGSIGNGTVANVKVDSWNWEFNGKSGTSFGLAVVQVVDFVEYKSSGGGGLMEGLSALDGDSLAPVADDEDAY